MKTLCKKNVKIVFTGAEFIEGEIYDYDVFDDGYIIYDVNGIPLSDSVFGENFYSHEETINALRTKTTDEILK